MFRNYFKVAIRNLFKQRGLSAINVIGLSVGVACFSLFMFYAINEFSFDRFHDKKDRIYRVYRWTEAIFDEDPGGDASLPMPLGPAMLADLPDVEAFVRMRPLWGDQLVRVNGEVVRRGITFADPNFFEVFTFPLLKGNPALALADPQNLILTASEAQNLFGESDPLGQLVEIQIDDEFQPFTVTAIAADPPSNSTIQFGLLASFERFAQTRFGRGSVDNWGRSAFTTFVLLQPGSDLADDATQLLAFRERYYPDTEANLRAEGHWQGDGPPVTYRLQHLESVHTEATVNGAFVDPVDPANVWLLLSIAAGVLLIACINFTTLAIGRSAGRAREVGVRKVVGGNRMQLTTQFLAEALLLSSFSTVVGLGLARMILPAFNQLAGRELVFSVTQYPELVWLSAGLIFVVGLLSGSYPALILARFSPIQVLKRRVRLGGANALTRTLVTFQFVLSIGLILAMVVVLQQVDFLREKNPGFDRENVVVIDASGVDTEVVLPRFRQALSGNPDILGIAGAELALGAGSGWGRVGWDYNGEHKSTYDYFVDYEYMDVLGLQLAAGRNFNHDIASDTSTSVIVNEAFVRDMGWTPAEALGQALAGYGPGEAPVVIGVVNDFHFRSMHETVEPQLFHQFSDYQPFQFLVRLQAGSTGTALNDLRQTWTRLAPGLSFEYSFLDDRLDQFYRAEARLGKIIAWAGGLSIFLACLGLLGLATLSIANRTREVGIRKVLGASNAHLIRLLSGNYVKLVLLAVVLASPVGWILMQGWLEQFAYRIDLSFSHVAVAGGVVLFVTLATVSIQALRATFKDPVDALRYE